MAITIVGLGPGDPALLTRQAWDVLSGADEIYARTSRHPTLAGLPARVKVHSFDAEYQESDDFASVYSAIAARVLTLGRRPEGVIYAVPGHPLVGEATVVDLLNRASTEKMHVRIVEGLSFIEPVLSALQVDGMTGIQVVDAMDIAGSLHPHLNPDAPALLGQLYSRDLAGDVKLTLMSQYPDEHPVYLIHAAGTTSEKVESIPLYALDHGGQIAHLTALYVPPLPVTSGLSSFQDTIARLRGPGGCPWDQEQTHQSLAQGLIEETAEVLDAIDADDMGGLCEELGDLLLHVVMQAQIATEDGDFMTSDMIAGIEAKIRRRHPHVFAEAQVSDVGEVLTNWNSIKRQERGQGRASSAMDGVPAALSALAQAGSYSRKAAEAGLDWPTGDDLPAKVREEVGALMVASSHKERVIGLGNLLFSIVNWARRMEVDTESALRLATRRFRQRFLMIENAVAAMGMSVSDLDEDEITAIWREKRLPKMADKEQ